MFVCIQNPITPTNIDLQAWQFFCTSNRVFLMKICMDFSLEFQIFFKKFFFFDYEKNFNFISDHSNLFLKNKSIKILKYPYKFLFSTVLWIKNQNLVKKKDYFCEKSRIFWKCQIFQKFFKSLDKTQNTLCFRKNIGVLRLCSIYYI